MQSFLLTLSHPRAVPPQEFALNEEKKKYVI
jgi:hypothetical protein